MVLVLPPEVALAAQDGLVADQALEQFDQHFAIALGAVDPVGLVVLDVELLLSLHSLLDVLHLSQQTAAHGASQLPFLLLPLGHPHLQAFGVEVVMAVLAVYYGSLIFDAIVADAAHCFRFECGPFLR